MTVRCRWCGKKLQRRSLVVKSTIKLPLCKKHEQYRHELRGEQAWAEKQAQELKR